MDPRVYVPTSAGPALEPITVDDARTWLKLSTSDDDATIARKIKAARVAGEHHTGRPWLTQTLTWNLDAWPEGRELELPRPPLQSVTSIKYYDVDGVQRTFAASNYFEVPDLDAGIVRLKPAADWPDLEADRPAAIEIVFVAGYGDALADVPADYLAGFELLLTHLMRNRSQEETGTNIVSLVYGLEDLWAPGRILPLS